MSSRRPRSLFRQIFAIAAIIGAITAAVAGLLTASLVRADAQSRARQTLSKLADAAAVETDEGVDADRSERRTVRTLSALDVRTLRVSPTGVVTPANSPLRAALTPADVDQLVAGKSVSDTQRVGASLVLVEGRPTPAGGIVLVQREQDAIGDIAGVIARVAIAFVVALGVAALLALWLSRRVARPLRVTADAAHALATGDRAVRIEASGPSEVRELADAVNTLTASLAQSETRQREFLQTVSHDLRTPLTTIRGYAESLADGVIPPAEVGAVGATVLGEAHRLTRLVSDLLDLSRAEAGELRIEPIPTDLTALVAGAADVWRPQFAGRGVRLTSRADPVSLDTDPGRVRQILDGLLSNAARVVPAGQQVALDLRREPASAVLEVRDSGPGLTDEDLPVAFERGVLHDRYLDSRSVGTGLGLAIVRQLVLALGGQIEAGHAPEGGARFTIRLPLPSANGRGAV